MTKNNPPGDGHRIGVVRERSQTVAPSGHYVKRGVQTGRFVDVESDKTSFKSVWRERSRPTMLERLTDYFITKPRRLVTLGTGLVRAGGFLVVACLLGQVAATAASAVKGLGGGMQAEVALSDALPGYLSVWMPETALGFAVAILLLLAGLIAVHTGRVFERNLGN